jgi:2-dehydropantoate 2-reductase
MQFVVLGAGAIGSVFGGLLAGAGHAVALIGRQAHCEAIRREGLLIDGIWGAHHIRTVHCYERLAECPAQQLEACDAALLTVKSYDTEAMLADFLAECPDPPPVVSLQNGLGNVERVERHVGRHRAIGGRVIFGVEYRGPGHVSITVSADRTKIGYLDGSADMACVRRLAEVFSGCGLACDAVPDIQTYIYAKMLYNCSLNALATLLGVPYGRLLEHRPARHIMRDIIGELFAVAEAGNIPLAWTGPDDYAEHLFTTLIPATAGHHPSMLQDIRRSKPTEIEALNGAIVEMGRRHGVLAPCNEQITRLIRAREALAASAAA